MKELSPLQYLTSRNLTSATIIEWQLGYCPDWRVITQDVIRSDHFAVAEKIGLVTRSEGEHNTWDTMHHRITIPIHDAQGRLVGFGGRLMPGTEGPKYINPVDSPVYSKSRILFGLHKARRGFVTHGMACLVEGYFDVIKLHQCGWDNAVASCGTALTEGQAKQLRRYTDTVLVLRDGDKAGRRAMEKDIPILLKEQFNVFVCPLPDGEDPDTLFDDVPKMRNTVDDCQDAIEWLSGVHMKDASASTSAYANAINKIVELLAIITNTVRREAYVKKLAKTYKLKSADLSRPLDRYFKDQEAQKLEDAEEDRHEKLPAWVDKQNIIEDRFAQCLVRTATHGVGVYFLQEKALTRLTNFTIRPLFHVYDQGNNRRLVELSNGTKTVTVEIPTQAMIVQNSFETVVMDKGEFYVMPDFAKRQFKMLMNWMVGRMPMAYELKTLGWQTEGFFAYSNAVYHDGNLINYDDLGMVKVGEKHFLSLGLSTIYKESRETDNPYENDLYLKHVPALQGMGFSQWARLFAAVYDRNAPYGIAFVFMSLFKDLFIRVAKMPMLYLSGPKGSGKSRMGESITWLFFSGKSPEGDLIHGFNLNPGQSTQFSFFNRVSRFRNCPMLMNEFDEEIIEDWKYGSFKAAYDGEGREVGSVDRGKKDGTRIQKIQGTLIIVGQYLSIKDDGSVLSRSVTCQFSLERISNLSQEQQDAHRHLESAEQAGLAGILPELLRLRPQVQQSLSKEFAGIQSRMMQETRDAGQRVEARLISNYSLVLAATKVMEDAGIQLPYSYDAFFEECKGKVIAHNRMLKDNNALQQFWKGMEAIYDKGIIQDRREFKILTELEVVLREGSADVRKKFVRTTRVLYVRFAIVHGEFAKYYRERTGSAPLPEQTYLTYLKDQAYYIGMCPRVDFEKRTSAYAFNYEILVEMGIVLEKNGTNDVASQASARTEELSSPVHENLPF